MEIAFLWIALSIACAFLAARRGRSVFGWFLISIFFTPLVGFVFLLVLPSKAIAPGHPTPETHVKCPECRELVLRDARKCKHCGTALIPQ